MPRVLLLFPTRTYRAEAFLSAAGRLGLDVTVGSEEASSLAGLNPTGLLKLDFNNLPETVRTVERFSAVHPIHAVIPVDEQTAVAAAALARMLGLRHNSVEAASAAANKREMLERLSAGGVSAPPHRLCTVGDDASALACEVVYPCVVKPLILSGSRGVIRADDPLQFAAAFARLSAILDDPEVRGRGDASRQILIQPFVAGTEVAVEGILTHGIFRLLAIFDKPDPLDGPFFEETIYVTPSRLPTKTEGAVAGCVARACKALGLSEGPVHAEVRIHDGRPCMIEIAARSIGGRCSQVLRFQGGASLEELILRHALGLDIESLERDSQAAGVMMIPTPRAGIFRAVGGLAEAVAVVGVEEITITAHPGQRLVPLPEGSRYLGFIFARAEESASVETALRRAHGCLDFVVE